VTVAMTDRLCCAITVLVVPSNWWQMPSSNSATWMVCFAGLGAVLLMLVCGIGESDWVGRSIIGSPQLSLTGKRLCRNGVLQRYYRSLARLSVVKGVSL